MIQYSINNLRWLKDLLLDLPEGVYEHPSAMLSGSSIGQHTRHIIELYQCLCSGYEDGLVCYDKRKRDRRIETDALFAESMVYEIIGGLDRTDKPLCVVYEIEDREIRLQSNYDRELMYNMEHAIHHMALIKVAVLELTDIILPKEFGVAPTTLQYRAECAQ